MRTLLVVATGIAAALLIGCDSEPSTDTSKVVSKDKAPAGFEDSQGAGGAAKPAKTAPDQSGTAP